jgi:hypothetical protein
MIKLVPPGVGVGVGDGTGVGDAVGDGTGVGDAVGDGSGVGVGVGAPHIPGPPPSVLPEIRKTLLPAAGVDSAITSNA